MLGEGALQNAYQHSADIGVSCYKHPIGIELGVDPLPGDEDISIGYRLYRLLVRLTVHDGCRKVQDDLY